MKHYDRTKRKWVGETEVVKKPRDKHVCKGGRPHSYVLVLPHGVSYGPDYKFNPEAYYAILDEIQDFVEQKKKDVEVLGIDKIKYSWSWNYSTYRHWVCSVCGKKEWLEKGKVPH